MDADWLLDSAENQFTYVPDDTFRIRTPLIEVTGRLDLFANSGLAWYENRMRTGAAPATMQAVMPMDRPFVFLHVQIEGEGAMELPGARRELVSSRSNIILRRSQDTFGMLEMPREQRAHICGIVATPEALADWFGGRVPAELVTYLAGNTPGAGDAPELNPAVFRYLAARIGEHHGPLRRIAAEGAALQMMTAYLEALCGGDAYSSALSAREERAVREARALLLADLRQPPTTVELAGMVGLSERRLDQAFRDLFGTSVFRTLSDARLEHAFEVLATGEVPVKELAFRLGYAHSSSFSHAFRARFGVFPSQIARS